MLRALWITVSAGWEAVQLVCKQVVEKSAFSKQFVEIQLVMVLWRRGMARVGIDFNLPSTLDRRQSKMTVRKRLFFILDIYPGPRNSLYCDRALCPGGFIFESNLKVWLSKTTDFDYWSRDRGRDWTDWRGPWGSSDKRSQETVSSLHLTIHSVKTETSRRSQTNQIRHRRLGQISLSLK